MKKLGLGLRPRKSGQIIMLVKLKRILNFTKFILSPKKNKKIVWQSWKGNRLELRFVIMRIIKVWVKQKIFNKVLGTDVHRKNRER
jgi:hypothetical protein